MTLFNILVTLVAVILAVAYLVQKARFNYWKKRKIPYSKPKIIFGNYAPFLLHQKTNGEVAMDICKQHPNEPYIGTFYGTEPALLVQDLELLKLITTKDYYYFSGREISNYSTKEVLTQSLFFSYGDKWKVLRQNMTPLFSSARMKSMFYLVENCSKVFERMLDEEFKVSPVREMKSTMARFTMDNIGSCVFGVDTRAMEDSADNPFVLIGKKIFEMSRVRGLAWMTRAIWPAIFYGLGFKTFPVEGDRFFSKLLGAVFAERENKPASRNDFIDLLVELKKNQYMVGDKMENLKTSDGAKIKMEVRDEVLISQAQAFFAAGYDTSANTSAMTLFEIAKHPEVQQRVLEEVDSYLKARGGKILFDCTTDLPYLDQCVSEAMRLYPVLGLIARETYDSYTLPDGLQLDRGMRVHIPVYHLHMDPKYFPEPLKFKPERFSNEEKNRVPQYTYMPFGVGPRLCIGQRFAKMQMLSGLVTILKKFRVTLADGMPETITLDPTAIVAQSREPVMLKLIPRDGWEERVFK